METDLRKSLKIASGSSLGCGSFAIVYRATWDGRPCALKVLRPEHSNAAQHPNKPTEMLRREGEALMLNPHRFLVRCYAVLDLPPSFPGLAPCYTLSAPALVLELMEEGSLLRLMRRQQLAPWRPLYDDATALDWSIQVASALAHLHGLSPPVIHRDIKLDNVLLMRPDARGLCTRRTAKLVDLGLHTKPLEERHRRQPLFRASRSLGGGRSELSTQSIGGMGLSAAPSDLASDGRSSGQASNLGSSPLFFTKPDGAARPVAVNPRSHGFRNLDKPLLPLPAMLMPPPSPPSPRLLPPLGECKEPEGSAYGDQDSLLLGANPEEVELLEGPRSGCCDDWGCNTGGTALVLRSSTVTSGTLMMQTSELLVALGPDTLPLPAALTSAPLMAEGEHGRGFLSRSGAVEACLRDAAQPLHGRPMVHSAAAEPTPPPHRAPPLAMTALRQRSLAALETPQQKPSLKAFSDVKASSGAAGAHAVLPLACPRHTAVGRGNGKSKGNGSGGSRPGPRSVARELSANMGQVVTNAFRCIADKRCSEEDTEACCQRPMGHRACSQQRPRSLLPSAAQSEPSAANLDRLTLPCEVVFRMTGETGSCMTMAPEVYMALPYNEKADVFSFAVVLYKLFSHSMLFATHIGVKRPDLPGVLRRCDEYTAVVASGYRPPRVAAIPEPVWLLITECWQEEPILRPAMNDVERRLRAIADEGKREAREEASVASVASGCAGGFGKRRASKDAPGLDSSADDRDAPGCTGCTIC